MKKHLVFIVNPNSGSKKPKLISSSIESNLNHKEYSYEIKTTEFAKHGTILAQKAAENNAFAVIAVGGDGSINDIIQGLIGTKTILGIIPKGSGNGLARTLKIPLKTDEAIKIINNCNTKMLDVGYANERPFISNAGVAFDAFIANKFAKGSGRGLLKYIWMITKYVWLYKSRVWEIEIDGETMTENAFIVNVANGQQLGYNFKIAPHANIDDGLLDLIIIKKFPKPYGAVLAFRGLNGTINKSPFVKQLRGKKITLSSPLLKMMQCDGDSHPSLHKIFFSISKNVQKIIVP